MELELLMKLDETLSTVCASLVNTVETLSDADRSLRGCFTDLTEAQRSIRAAIAAQKDATGAASTGTLTQPAETVIQKKLDHPDLEVQKAIKQYIAAHKGLTAAAVIAGAALSLPKVVNDFIAAHLATGASAAADTGEPGTWSEGMTRVFMAIVKKCEGPQLLTPTTLFGLMHSTFPGLITREMCRQKLEAFRKRKEFRAPKPPQKHQPLTQGALTEALASLATDVTAEEKDAQVETLDKSEVNE